MAKWCGLALSRERRSRLCALNVVFSCLSAWAGHAETEGAGRRPRGIRPRAPCSGGAELARWSCASRTGSTCRPRTGRKPAYGGMACKPALGSASSAAFLPSLGPVQRPGYGFSHVLYAAPSRPGWGVFSPLRLSAIAPYAPNMSAKSISPCAFGRDGSWTSAPDGAQVCFFLLPPPVGRTSKRARNRCESWGGLTAAGRIESAAVHVSRSTFLLDTGRQRFSHKKKTRPAEVHGELEGEAGEAVFASIEAPHAMLSRSFKTKKTTLTCGEGESQRNDRPLVRRITEAPPASRNWNLAIANCRNP